MSKIEAERWDETCELFHQLCDLDATTRAERLTGIESSDPELKAAVESLLAADDLANERLAHLEHGITDVLSRNLLESRHAVPDLLRLAGQTVSHFQIIEPIGAGGMGIVYRARDPRLNREVALKLPLAGAHLDSQGRARFLREAQAVGLLDHRNVCSVYEAGESADGQPFLVMALYAGESLRSRIARDGALPVTDALDIARQVALGLAFAHDAGVIHRDLKPGNVMLLPDGLAKILDFGLAKLAGLNHTSAVGMGTAGYMAPEQILGGSVDARADLWSLGVLLYEMLTGVRPFPGENAVAVSHAILHAEVSAPSALRPELGHSLDEVVVTLLNKEPAARYRGAHDVAVDLDSIQRGAKPVFRKRVSLVAAGWKKKKVALLAAGMIATIGIVAWFARPLRESEPTQNADAYQFYLRGREYEESGPLAAADTLYRRALTLDPDFALARAHLALVHLSHTLRPEEARLAQGKAEAIAALRTQPGLADAHYALGLYWQRHDLNERALAEFRLARRGMNKTAAFHKSMGTSYRSLGMWEEAVTEYELVRELDPRDVSHAPLLALTYGRLRRYRESQNTWARFIALNPDAYWAMIVKGYSVVRSDGTADTLAAALRRIPAESDDHGMTTFARFTLARLQRRPQDELAVLAVSQHGVSEDDMLFRPLSLLRGQAYEDAGNGTMARVQFENARAMMEDSVAEHPGDPRLQIGLGMALAGVGRKADAIRAARRAMAVAPLSKDVVVATCNMGGAAEIFAYLGENDAAISLLEQLMRMPAGREASVPLLRIDPAFDRLRSDPRFQRMLQRYATR